MLGVDIIFRRSRDREGNTMNGLEMLQSVQFVTAKGKRLAVVDAADWEALVEWLETFDDAQVAREAFAELQAAEGDRKRAGWLEWEVVEKEIG